MFCVFTLSGSHLAPGKLPAFLSGHIKLVRNWLLALSAAASSVPTLQCFVFSFSYWSFSPKPAMLCTYLSCVVSSFPLSALGRLCFSCTAQLRQPSCRVFPIQALNCTWAPCWPLLLHLALHTRCCRLAAGPERASPSTEESILGWPRGVGAGNLWCFTARWTSLSAPCTVAVVVIWDFICCPGIIQALSC